LDVHWGERRGKEKRGMGVRSEGNEWQGNEDKKDLRNSKT
jgi:hypothetical protein